MHSGALRAVLLGIGVLSAPFASADIYTWVDVAGVTNVSNVPPRENVRDVTVVRAAPKDPAQEYALREAARVRMGVRNVPAPSGHFDGDGGLASRGSCVSFRCAPESPCAVDAALPAHAFA